MKPKTYLIQPIEIQSGETLEMALTRRVAELEKESQIRSRQLQVMKARLPDVGES